MLVINLYYAKRTFRKIFNMEPLPYNMYTVCMPLQTMTRLAYLWQWH